MTDATRASNERAQVQVKIRHAIVLPSFSFIELIVAPGTEGVNSMHSHLLWSRKSHRLNPRGPFSVIMYIHYILMTHSSAPVKIPKRRLGKTDLYVTPIGLGCWQFSGMRGFWNPLPQEEINRIIETALGGGINWFDTAELYGRGESERALATALCKAEYRNKDVVIATKWMPFFRTSGNIVRTIDERISCLSPCNIDLYQIHGPNSFSSIEAQMDAMAALVNRGKIRYVGVSNFSARQMRRAHAALARHGLPLASNQILYNLLKRARN